MSDKTPTACRRVENIFRVFPFGRALLRRCRVQQSMATSIPRNEKLSTIIFVQITRQKAEATNLSECLARFHADIDPRALIWSPKFVATLRHFQLNQCTISCSGLYRAKNDYRLEPHI